MSCHTTSIVIENAPIFLLRFASTRCLPDLNLFKRDTPMSLEKTLRIRAFLPTRCLLLSDFSDQGERQVFSIRAWAACSTSFTWA